MMWDELPIRCEQSSHVDMWKEKSVRQGECEFKGPCGTASQICWILESPGHL